MTPLLRVVFDCNVLFQAFLSAKGPAGTLLAEAAGGSLSLYLSEKALEEVADVIRRPHLVAKLKYDPRRCGLRRPTTRHRHTR